MGDLMTQAAILLAVGEKGLALTPPEGVRILPAFRALDAGPPLFELAQQELVLRAVEQPRSGPPLKVVAKGRRRAVILVGDLALPAPYALAIQPVMAALLAAEIRPSRIAYLASPGGCGPLLGRGAIHRYGEEWVGEHEFHVWSGDGAADDPLFAAADLRVALVPALHRSMSRSFAADPRIDFAVELALGSKVVMDVTGAQAFGPGEKEFGAASESSPAHADLCLCSGGGGPWEATLEEALLSLHWMPEGAASAALAFDGAEGLGSARFTQDLWALLDQAEEVLAGGGTLGAPSSRRAVSFDPAGVVAEALRRFKNVTLLSQGLFEHPDGEELLERLEARPAVAAKISFLPNPAALWAQAEKTFGRTYSLRVEPLGWRSLSGG